MTKLFQMRVGDVLLVVNVVKVYSGRRMEEWY